MLGISDLDTEICWAEIQKKENNWNVEENIKYNKQ